jgi:hypothetical protein
LNLRPSGYEPDELPGCSTPRYRRTEAGERRTEAGFSVLRVWLGMLLRVWFSCLPFGRPGGDLLSHVLGRSTIGAEGFHGRVRDGIGCMAPRHDHQVVGTEVGLNECGVWVEVVALPAGSGPCMRRKDRIKPNERLVPVSFTHCCASTPGLSTWWSSTALKGEMVSRWVSRLDAFSGYPVRT